jgi:hypothetical protein
MKVGFGIAALVIALLAIFAPYGVNLVASAVAILLACLAAFAGDRAFSVATSLICIVNFFLFSPFTLAAISVAGGAMAVVFVMLVAATPFVAIALNASGKVVISQ